MRIAGHRLYAVLALLITAGLASLTPGNRTMAGADEKPHIITTIAQIADPVRQIVGNRMTVRSLMGEGVDPHSYRMNRRDIVALNNADMVFYNGLYLEAQMEDALERMAELKPVVPLAQSIDRQWLLASVDYDNQHDPHVWMDVQRWKRVVARAADVIVEFDPANSAEYRTNTARYLEELQRLDGYMKRVLDTVPREGRVVISAHDAFSYFGQGYGFEVLGLQGLSTASEAGLKRIETLVDLIVERRIKAVFIESSVAERNVRALIEGAAARGHEVIIGGTLFSDAMGRPGTYEGTYIGMLDHNASVITRALGGQAPATGMQQQLNLVPDEAR